jgi:hypothetical protein
MENLVSKIGTRFKKQRHGSYHLVILEDVRKDRVRLREVDHVDAFLLPIAKFLKFYKEVKV